MGLLKKYKSLSEQAEDIDEYEAYKELIDVIRNMSYEELYNMMWDTETALEVLLRGEAKGNNVGITEIVKKIMKLGKIYLDREELRIRYTYEFIEGKRNENGKDRGL